MYLLIKFLVQKNLIYYLNFSPKRCPPCRKLGEHIHKNYENAEGFVIVKIDCDKAEESISSNHSVSGIPAVFLYINGKREDCKLKFNFLLKYSKKS